MLHALRRCSLLMLLGGLGGCWQTTPASSPGSRPPPPGPSAPKAVPTPPADPVLALASRSLHTCALRKSGTVLCWGRNSHGQLGDGRTADSARLVRVANLADAVEVVTGHDFTCARRKNASVVCWGNNFDGQLGDGRGADGYEHQSLRPVKVTGLAEPTALSTGEYHVCAVEQGGAVKCWGNGDDGQIGSDAQRAFATPQRITQLGPATQVAAGWSHVCALEAKGTIGCWGRNTEGQLGDGKSGSRIKPVRVSGIADAVELVSGHEHSCARTRAGQVRCWGDNSAGQLGPGAGGQKKRNTPVAVPDLSGVVQLVAGDRHTCARLDTGRVICWGSNDAGQLGASTPSAQAPSRALVRGVEQAIDLAAGAQHTCALLKSHEIKCWGAGQHGALGPHRLN